MNDESKIKNGEVVFILSMYGNAERAIRGKIVKCISHSPNKADEYQIIDDNGRIHEFFYPNIKNEKVFILTRREYIDHLRKIRDENEQFIEKLEERSRKMDEIINREIDDFRRERQLERNARLEMCNGNHDYGEWQEFNIRSYQLTNDDNLNPTFVPIETKEWHRQCHVCGYYETTKEDPNLNSIKAK